MNKLLVLANSGRVRLLVFKEGGDDPSDQPHLQEAPGSPVQMRPLTIHQAVTDQAGRFRQGSASTRATGMSYGEEYELEKHLEAEAVKRVADKIDEWVTVANYPEWQLVAPSAILAGLEAALPGPTHRCLKHSDAGDLTQAPVAELEKRFL